MMQSRDDQIYNREKNERAAQIEQRTKSFAKDGAPKTVGEYLWRPNSGWRALSQQPEYKDTYSYYGNRPKLPTSIGARMLYVWRTRGQKERDFLAFQPDRRQTIGRIREAIANMDEQPRALIGAVCLGLLATTVSLALSPADSDAEHTDQIQYSKPQLGLSRPVEEIGERDLFVSCTETTGGVYENLAPGTRIRFGLGSIASDDAREFIGGRVMDDWGGNKKVSLVRSTLQDGEAFSADANHFALKLPGYTVEGTVVKSASGSGVTASVECLPMQISTQG